MPTTHRFFNTPIQRKCEDCAKEEKEKEVQKKSEGQTTQSISGVFNSFMNNISVKGTTLPDASKQFFERRLGTSLSHVRIHADAASSMAAKAIRAKAFAWQQHVVFNTQYYDIHSAAGRALLAHELTHVKQYNSQRPSLQRAPEQEADKEELQEKGIDTQSNSPNEKAAEQEEKKIQDPIVLPDFSTFGKPTHDTVFGKSVTVQGKTEAEFDNGVGTTSNLKGTPAEDCEGCATGECFNITGKLTIKYNVATTVSLPDVPEGLTACQEKNVRDAINNKIKPHEDKHVAAFKSYNGTVVLPINYKGCKDGLEAYVQKLHDENAVAREQAARRKSAALDPFHVPIDLDCDDETPKSK